MESIAAIDFGTDKIVVALASINAQQVCQLDNIKVAESRGIENGIINDFSVVQKTLHSLIGSMFYNKGVSCLRIYVPIQALSIHKHHVTLTLSKRTIGEAELAKAEQECIRIFESRGDIIEITPMSYMVDKNEVNNPLGRSGAILEIDYFVYTVSSDYASKIEKMFEEFVNIDIEFYSSILFYKNLVKKDCVLLEMGAGGMELAVFKGGLLKANAYLPLGGDSIDNDIAIGFGISQSKANILKEEYGQAVRGLCKNRKLYIPDTNLQINSKDLATIVQSRCEELFEGVVYFLRSNKELDKKLPIYLTGGVSKTQDIETLLRKMSGCDVNRIQIEDIVVRDIETLEDPQFTLVLSLLRHNLSIPKQVKSKETFWNKLLKWK